MFVADLFTVSLDDETASTKTTLALQVWKGQVALEIVSSLPGDGEAERHLHGRFQHPLKLQCFFVALRTAELCISVRSLAALQPCLRPLRISFIARHYNTSFPCVPVNCVTCLHPVDLQRLARGCHVSTDSLACPALGLDGSARRKLCVMTNNAHAKAC